MYKHKKLIVAVCLMVFVVSIAATTLAAGILCPTDDGGTLVERIGEWMATNDIERKYENGAHYQRSRQVRNTWSQCNRCSRSYFYASEERWTAWTFMGY